MIDNQDIKQQQRNEIKKFQLDFEDKHGIELYIISSLKEGHTLTLKKFTHITKQCIAEDYPKYKNYTYKTKSRERDFVKYIQAMSFLAHTDGYSYTAIGKAVNRNHATIIHSCKLVKNCIENNDMEFIKVLNTIQKKIDKYVGTISEDFKRKDVSKSVPNTIWDEARRIINS
jgi:chromosomal replication initiation ATPase DnaA